MWIFYGILAGIILGLYDVYTKKSLINNNVLAVSLYSSLFGMMCWLPFAFIESSYFYVDVTNTNIQDQYYLLLKNIGMVLSWVLAYHSVKNLPVTISGAIRASGPVWTLIGGMLIFSEYLDFYESIGLITCITSYYLLSVVGKKEGINFLNNKSISMMLVATLISSGITVYDKFLVQDVSIDSNDIQFYSSIHRFLILFVFSLFYSLILKRKIKVNWSFSIAIVGIAWVVAEWVYFLAYSDNEAKVVYLAIFRRSSILVSFLAAAFIFKESLIKEKFKIILLLLLGMIILTIS